jgi:hypothetical protein
MTDTNLVHSGPTQMDQEVRIIRFDSSVNVLESPPESAFRCFKSSPPAVYSTTVRKDADNVVVFYDHEKFLARKVRLEIEAMLDD